MPYSIRIEAATGVAVATCSGVLRLAEALEGAEALWKNSEWPGGSAVWDFREAKFDISSADTREMARFILEHQPTPPPAKIAFVTPRAADFGMARMFEVFRADPQTEFAVFKEYDEAVSWARAIDPGSL